MTARRALAAVSVAAILALGLWAWSAQGQLVWVGQTLGFCG